LAPLDHDLPGAVGGRLAVDFQRHELAGEVLEVVVDLLRRLCFLSVYGDQIVAALPDARRGERRAVASTQFSPG